MTTRRGLLGLAAAALGGQYIRRLEDSVPTFASGGVVRDFHVSEFIGERTIQTLTLKVDTSQVRDAVDSHFDRIKSAVDAAIKDHAERLHCKITTGLDVPNRLAGVRINSEGDAV